MPKFFAEITDTFGGEANYCWVHRFIIEASSMRGAVWKLTRETGYSFRMDYNTGDLRRYNVPRAAVCMFIEWADDNIVDQYPNAKRI